jgi:hypothetical protein
MATNAKWLALAKKLYTTTFAGQAANTVVLSLLGDIDYDTQEYEILATDTITVARVYNAALSKYNGTSVQVGDRFVGIINENLTVDPRTDNVRCVVNGVAVSIESALIDEAGAIYTLQVRDL